MLDFIGNYEKAGKAPLLLAGGEKAAEKKAYNYSEIEYPDDCIVDFDMHLIDLFKELDKKSLSIKKQIDQGGFAIALRDDLKDCIENEAFQFHMKNILEYRTMEYYRRRYEEKAR